MEKTTLKKCVHLLTLKLRYKFLVLLFFLFVSTFLYSRDVLANQNFLPNPIIIPEGVLDKKIRIGAFTGATAIGEHKILLRIDYKRNSYGSIDFEKIYEVRRENGGMITADVLINAGDRIYLSLALKTFEGRGQEGDWSHYLEDNRIIPITGYATCGISGVGEGLVDYSWARDQLHDVLVMACWEDWEDYDYNDLLVTLDFKPECFIDYIKVPDKSFGLSALLPLEFEWTSRGFCSDYTFELGEKANKYDLADNSDCNFANAQKFTTKELGVFLNANNSHPAGKKSDITLEWDTAYCWRVNGDPRYTENVNAENKWTFRTNASPEFSRMGMQFTDLVQADGVIGSNIDQQINAGVRKCNVSQDKCNTETNTNTLGGEYCWLSGNTKDKRPDLKDRTFNLWFDYKDADSGINPLTNELHPNEAFEHSFAFVAKGDISNDTANVQDIEEHAEFYIKHSNLKESKKLEFCNDTSCSTTNLENEFLKLKDKRVFAFDDNTLRTLYQFEIKNVDISQMFEIYTMSANAVYDPYHEWTQDRLPDSTTANTPLTMYENRMYTKKGQIGIDNIVPKLDIPKPFITGFNAFDVKWINTDIGVGAGIADFQAYCYSDENITPYTLVHHDSDPKTSDAGLARNLNIQYFDIPQDQQEGEYNFGAYNECVRLEDKQILLGSQAHKTLTTSYRFANPDQYVNFDHLVLRVQSLKDAACNVGDTKEDEQYLFKNWISTRQGSTFCDPMISFSKNTKGDGYIKESNDLIAGFANAFKVVYANTNPKILDLSTDFLGSKVSLNLQTSTTNQSIETYNDLNNKPRYGVNGATWAQYFTNLMSIKNHTIEESTQTSVKNISDLTATCTQGAKCFVKTTGDLTLQNQAVCDIIGVIFVNGKLTVADSLRNLNENTGCIFVVNGSMRVESANQTYSISRKDINTSIYDTLEGFFIVEKGEIFVGKDKEAQDQDVIYTDGLMVRGGLVQSSGSQRVDIQRTLGLRNNIQPPVLMIYDPRYISLFLDILGYSNLRIKEMEF
jgi:hypothetical protein